MPTRSYRGTYFAAIKSILLICATLLTLGACHAEPTDSVQPVSNSPTAQPATKALESIEVEEVTWALDGTDLLNFSSIPLANTTPNQNWTGRYRSEQGGSIIDFSLTADDPFEKWYAVRIYQEPGRPSSIKKYTLQQQQNRLVDTEKKIEIIKSKEGILVLERQSDLENIPAGYWIHYLK